MATLRLSLSFLLVLLSVLVKMTQGSFDQERRTEDILRLSPNCPSLMVRLDQYDRVELTSNIWPIPNTVVPGNLTCTAHYMTGNTDLGICIESNDLFFKSPTAGIQLKIFTSRFGPEKAFNYFHPKFKKWCTKENIVSIEVTSTRDFHDQNGDYNFRFLLTNVSKESVSKHYRMDSFKECNLAHLIKSGEEIRVSAQEYPAPTSLPSSCQLTFSTWSEEDFEEICLRIVDNRTSMNCLSTLRVSGFNTRFWPESEVLGCNDTHSKLRAGQEMCSSSKTLTFSLSRTSATDTGLTFSAVIKVKKHPYWQVISDENSELRVLEFVKGLTYFVAAIDSLAGIVAAILTSMFRRPRSFWKSWASSVTVPEKCEDVHYEDSSYQAMSSSKVEEIMEVKSY